MSEKSRNLTKNEKDIIFKLILKYKSKIENKETDSVSVAERNSAWENITKEFNATSTSNYNKRTSKQIKVSYKNAKSSLKKDLALEKKERFKTGGGSFTHTTEELNITLFDIVSDEITPLQNKFDSSQDYFSGINEKYAETESINENNEDEESIIYNIHNVPESESRNDKVEIETPKKQNYQKAKSWARKRANNEDIRKYVDDFSQLKKEKLESDIVKNKKKTEMYETKTELMKLQIQDLKGRMTK